MIYLTKKDPERTRFIINHRLVERIDEHESTVIMLQNGKKYIVDESPEEIIEKIIEFESHIALRSLNKKEA